MYRVQFRADAETSKRFGYRVGGPAQWITVSAKPVRLTVAERVAACFRLDYPDALIRIVPVRS